MRLRTWQLSILVVCLVTVATIAQGLSLYYSPQPFGSEASVPTSGIPSAQTTAV